MRHEKKLMIKEKVIMFDYIKIKNFNSLKDTIFIKKGKTFVHVTFGINQKDSTQNTKRTLLNH